MVSIQWPVVSECRELSPPLGNSPVRGNVGNADKRVAVPAKERVAERSEVGRGDSLTKGDVTNVTEGLPSTAE